MSTQPLANRGSTRMMPARGRVRPAPPGSSVLLAVSAVLSVLVLTWPDFLISSDSLFPAAFTRDMLHGDAPWSGLQQPHIPSFFPDLLVFGAAQSLTGSWRAAMAIWVLVVLVWLAMLLTAITDSIASADSGDNAGEAATIPSRDPAMSVVLTLLVLIFTAAVLGLPSAGVPRGDTPFFAWLLILVPYGHGGPFLLALTTAVLAFRALRRSSLTTLSGVALMACATALSDQLCLISLLAPLAVAVLCGLAVHVLASSCALRVLASAWFGGALGFALAGVLERQFMPSPSIALIPERASRLLTSLGYQPDMLIVPIGIAIALIIDVRRLGLRGFLGDFWRVFAVTSALGAVALMLMLYEDAWSYRYALPVLWWALVRSAVALTTMSSLQTPLGSLQRHLGGFRRRARLATGLMAGLVLMWLATGTRVPRLLTWSSPLAECLIEHDLRAGLGDFWLARKTTAASDWLVQVEPIDNYGQGRIWGNNRFWFTHDLNDPSRRPPFRFIIMDRLPEERIVAAYGPPDRLLRCGNSIVWLFDDVGRLHRALERASPLLGEEFAAAPPL